MTEVLDSFKGEGEDELGDHKLEDPTPNISFSYSYVQA